MIIYNARILHGSNFDLIEGYLKIEKGIITEIKKGTIKGDLDAEKSIIMPALINAHVHILDSIAKEKITSMPLDELVRPPNGLKQKILKDTPFTELLESATNVVNEMLSNGILTFFEFSNNPDISNQANIYKKAKIYYEPPIAQIDSEIEKNEFDQSIIDSICENAKKCNGVGLSGVGEFSESVLSEIEKLNLPQVIHAGEHIISQNRSLSLTGKTEIERVISLKPKFIVHATNPFKGDVEHIIKNKIPIICCPRCNCVLGVGFPPIKEFLDNGILVALGTDNVMLNSPDLFREMEFTLKVMNFIQAQVDAISPNEILKMVTVNPAKILNLNSGVIQKGNDADLLFIKPLRNMNPINDIVSAIVNRADARNVWKVLNKGDIIYECSNNRHNRI